MVRELIRNFIAERTSVLEVGAGRGELLMEIAESFGLDAWGIDPHVPRRDYGKITLSDIPAEEIGSLGRRFDLVFSVYSLHHFGDVDLFLHGMREVLTPKGLFIFVDYRKGTETGIPEYYFAFEDISRRVAAAGYGIIDSGEDEENFYIVGGQ